MSLCLSNDEPSISSCSYDQNIREYKQHQEEEYKSNSVRYYRRAGVNEHNYQSYTIFIVSMTKRSYSTHLDSALSKLSLHRVRFG